MQMQAFCDFMESIIKASSNTITRADLQPGRIPFFVSACWHMQGRERWPIFYPNTKKAFEQEGHYKIPSSPTDYYFTFRETFFELQKGLGWSSWEMEHVCDWMILMRNGTRL